MHLVHELLVEHLAGLKAFPFQTMSGYVVLDEVIFTAFVLDTLDEMEVHLLVALQVDLFWNVALLYHIQQFEAKVVTDVVVL